MHRALHCAGALLGFLLAVAQPPEGAAQFGKIKKAMGQKAAETAGDKAAGQASEASTGSACIPARPPIIVDAVPLTLEQMAKINAGLDAEIAAAPSAKQELERQDKAAAEQQKARDKAYAEYDKRNGPWNECARKLQDEDVAKTDKMNQDAQASGSDIMGGMSQKDLEELGRKAQEAAQRVSEGRGTAEDRKTLAEFQATMAKIQSGATDAASKQQAVQQYQQGADKRVEAKCGKRPEPPPDVPAPPNATDIVHTAGAKAAGVPLSTWRQWREDMLALATSNTVVKSGTSDKAGKDGASSKDADGMNQQIKETAKKVCALQKAGVM